jgi:hypothetical protein
MLRGFALGFGFGFGFARTTRLRRTAFFPARFLLAAIAASP